MTLRLRWTLIGQLERWTFVKLFMILVMIDTIEGLANLVNHLLLGIHMHKSASLIDVYTLIYMQLDHTFLQGRIYLVDSL